MYPLALSQLSPLPLFLRLCPSSRIITITSLHICNLEVAQPLITNISLRLALSFTLCISPLQLSLCSTPSFPSAPSHFVTLRSSLTWLFPAILTLIPNIFSTRFRVIAYTRYKINTFKSISIDHLHKNLLSFSMEFGRRRFQSKKKRM